MWIYERENKRYICLIDSITTHNVFNNDIYISYLLVIEASFNIITSSKKMIQVSGRANIYYHKAQ